MPNHGTEHGAHRVARVRLLRRPETHPDHTQDDNQEDTTVTTNNPTTTDDTAARIKSLLLEALEAIEGSHGAADEHPSTAGDAVLAALDVLGQFQGQRLVCKNVVATEDPLAMVVDDYERNAKRADDAVLRCSRRIRERCESIERDVTEGWHAESAPDGRDLAEALGARRAVYEALTAVRWAWVRTLDAPALIALAAKRFNELPDGTLNKPDVDLYNGLPSYERAIIDRIVAVLDDGETFHTWSVLSQVQDEAWLMREGGER